MPCGGGAQSRAAASAVHGVGRQISAMPNHTQADGLPYAAKTMHKKPLSARGPWETQERGRFTSSTQTTE